MTGNIREQSIKTNLGTISKKAGSGLSIEWMGVIGPQQE